MQKKVRGGGGGGGGWPPGPPCDARSRHKVRRIIRIF